MFYTVCLLIGSYSILWEIPNHICHQSVQRLILSPYRYKLWNPQLLRYVYVKTGHIHSHLKRQVHRTSVCVMFIMWDITKSEIKLSHHWKWEWNCTLWPGEVQKHYFTSVLLRFNPYYSHSSITNISWDNRFIIHTSNMIWSKTVSGGLNLYN